MFHGASGGASDGASGGDLPIDRDIAYMSQAKRFLSGEHGFSKLMARMVERNGGRVDAWEDHFMA